MNGRPRCDRLTAATTAVRNSRDMIMDDSNITILCGGLGFERQAPGCITSKRSASPEHNLFGQLAGRSLRGYPAAAPLREIGTPTGLEQAEYALAAISPAQRGVPTCGS